MKVNLSEKKERKEKGPLLNELSLDPSNILKVKELNELTSQEIDDLSIEDLDYLRQKYQVKHLNPTIIGKKPYQPFLAGITGDTWMSVGDKVKED